MNKDLPGKNESIWMATTPSTNYPQLKGELKVDVAIVGGGFAGITAAYYLSRLGLKTAIVEAFKIATGTSGYTTAKITSLHRLIYDYLINDFGKEKAQIYADSNQWAIEEYESIIEKEKIDCNFSRENAYTFANRREDFEKIKKEYEAAKSLGLPAFYEENINLLPFQLKTAIRFSNQAVFHPRKFLLSLAEKVIQNGSLIFEDSAALDIKEDNPCEVKTDQGTLKAENVIIATNYPIYDKGMFFARMDQERSYALTIEVNSHLKNGMFIGVQMDEPSVRHYNKENDNLLIFGGEGHVAGENGNSTDHFLKLIELASKLFDVRSIKYRWLAQDSSPFDRIPFIGPQNSKSKHIYVTTGYNKWGITKSLISAKILSDEIMGKKNDWANLYNPSRFNLKASVSKFTQMGKQLFKGYSPRISTSGNRKFGDLKKGEGKVINKDGKKIAVYVDENGNPHAVSAVCTHMGCIVDWNNGEKTWDCPCHGSRYTKDGKVINGPAKRALSPEEI